MGQRGEQGQHVPHAPSVLNGQRPKLVESREQLTEVLTPSRPAASGRLAPLKPSRPHKRPIRGPSKTFGLRVSYWGRVDERRKRVDNACHLERRFSGSWINSTPIWKTDVTLDRARCPDSVSSRPGIRKR